jgi:pyruvate kinase
VFPLRKIMTSEGPPGAEVVRRTKILATIGPASSSEDLLRQLIAAGANGFRLNFSHAAADRASLVARIRKEASAAGVYLPILGDVQGPKLRIGEVEGVVTPKVGSDFTITTETIIGDARRVSTPFESLPREVKPGHRILINDGLVELVVSDISSSDVHTTVLHTGPISSNKGMNFPDSELTIPAITEKDREDLRFAVRHGLEYVAASFIRRKEDIEELRSILDGLGGRDVQIIAKIEKAQAIDNLEAILKVSDGVMVARGDLGVELPPERVPIIQKKLLRMASDWGRFAITATQMLESMTSNSRPTRAEASDVANAIFDGTDAVMLSAETATGAFPVESVSMMSRIVVTAEQNPQLDAYTDRAPFRESLEKDEFTDALAGATNYAAEHIGARYIVLFTQSGFSARLMSKFRPRVPVIALTRTIRVARQLNLLWGVTPHILNEPGSYHEQVVEQVEQLLIGRGMVERGDRIVILMGSPLYQRARTNLLRVHRIGA